MLIKDKQFEVLGACKVKMVDFRIAQASDWLNGLIIFNIYKVLGANVLQSIGVPGVKRLVVVRNKCVDVFVQEEFAHTWRRVRGAQQHNTP